MTSPTFADTIKNLYQEAELPMLSAEHPIAPLGLLIRHVGLIGVELAGLAISTASDFLLWRGGADEALPKLTPDPLAGFLCVVPGYGGCVFVERNDGFARRRFSAAHELGHYLLHFRPRLTNGGDFDQPLLDAFPKAESDDTEPGELPLGQLTLPGVETASAELEHMEREANEFAAELLMPAEVVLDLCRLYRPHLDGNDLAQRLAGDLLVSRAAMRWRLRNLGLSMPPEARLN